MKKKTELRALDVTKLDGDKSFHCAGAVLPTSVIDFWKWAYSNLAANNLRGHLAEFLVASDLKATQQVRVEWGDCDLRMNGVKVEVKSAAYCQSWGQSKHSVISFGIAPSRAYNSKNKARESAAARNSDVYVFCLLGHKDKQTLDPTNLDQWEFYVLPTQKLDAELGGQKTLSLNRLLELTPIKCCYGAISQTIHESLGLIAAA